MVEKRLLMNALIQDPLQELNTYNAAQIIDCANATGRMVI